MRERFFPGAAAGVAFTLALAAVPAAAQVQQNNPDAANQSFALQGQFRAQQQQRVSDFNTLGMQIQRNAQYHPSQGYPGQYGAYGRVRAHSGRAVRTHRSLSTSICTGC